MEYFPLILPPSFWPPPLAPPPPLLSPFLSCLLLCRCLFLLSSDHQLNRTDSASFDSVFSGEFGWMCFDPINKQKIQSIQSCLFFPLWKTHSLELKRLTIRVREPKLKTTSKSTPTTSHQTTKSHDASRVSFVIRIGWQFSPVLDCSWR